MSVLLWAVQIVLAVLCLSGGAYKVFSFDQVANEAWYGALPSAGWAGLGVFEMLCGVLLIVPSATKRMPILTPLAAAALVVENLGLAVVYGSHSLELTASNPLVFAVAMGLLAAFVAYGRFVLRPLGQPAPVEL